MAENKKISELPSNNSPSTSTTLVGVDNGETVQIPITEFVTKDDNGNVEIRKGSKVTFYNTDESDYCTLECDEDGNLSLNGITVATLDNIPSGDASGDPSIPCISFGCYSPEFTVADLMNELPSAVWTSGQPAIANFMGMLSGTFLCRFSEYHSGYYGCEFTDLTNLKTYYFEGESRSLSLYDNLSNDSGAGLSMPRIRLASHGQGEDVITCNKDSKEWFGSYIFSVEIMDGTVQEGDQLQICSLTNHKNSRGVRVRKPRRFSERVITAEDIEMLSYNPYLQILVEGEHLRELYRSCSSDGTLYRYPKYIRIRRPKYDEEGQETGATFSNVVCVDVRLPVEFFNE